jgi:hypothetical protein
MNFIHWDFLHRRFSPVFSFLPILLALAFNIML